MITPEERAADEAVIADYRATEKVTPRLEREMATEKYRRAAVARWPAYMAENADMAENAALRAENAKLKAALKEIRTAMDVGADDWPPSETVSRDAIDDIRAIVERVTAEGERRGDE